MKKPIEKWLVILNWITVAVWLLCLVLDLTNRPINTLLLVCHVVCVLSFGVTAAANTRQYRRQQAEKQAEKQD